MQEHHQVAAAEWEGMVQPEINVEEWIPVRSDYLAAYRYDPSRLYLDIRFKNGAEWRYKGATPRFLQTFLEAPSKGKFFHKNIKGHFQSEDLNKA